LNFALYEKQENIINPVNFEDPKAQNFNELEFMDKKIFYEVE
jgi:hypothetical protein